MINIKRNQSAEKMIDTATEKITSEMNGLCTRRNDAIFAFRATRDEIDSVNSDLEASIIRLDKLIDFANHAKETAVSSITENKHIREKIVEIIGED